MSTEPEFDVIVYGASGFTGKLVVEYLAKTYPSGAGVSWAMAGRSTDKLAAVRDAMGAPADTALIEADAGDAASLKAMAARGKCILTTVGPYTHYGEPLVAACVEAGAGYVDLSGEPLWMREMIEKYGQAAAQSGARIVHSCGFDSIPFDLGVQHLQEAAMEKFGKPFPRVRGRMLKMQGTFSGGTAASLGATMVKVKEDPSLLGHLIDPFCLTEAFKGPEQPPINKVREDDGVWLAPFIMAPINTKNIHRSNALLGHAYGEDFVYDEMMLAGEGEKGKAAADQIAGVKLDPKTAPKPGEGPSREEREAGFYDYIAIGSSPDGETLTAKVTGDRDPGYGSTSKIIAEAAICLVQDCPDLAGGVYTPAPAMGAKLRARLVEKAGLTFDIV